MQAGAQTQLCPLGRLAPAADLRVLTWGESSDVFFDPASGLTHRVAAAPSELLRWLGGQAGPLDEAAARAEFDGIAEPELVDRWITELLALGLLRRVPA